MHAIGTELAEEVGMMRRVWDQTEGQPELQARVAAIALAYFCRETPAWLELIRADTALADLCDNP
jgi:hypothetical protein